MRLPTCSPPLSSHAFVYMWVDERYVCVCGMCLCVYVVYDVCVIYMYVYVCDV